jgi:hypothetical protein
VSNIGELFVNLSIKGTEKTVGALGSVKKGLSEVSSMSLEAKAGILAALYGLERLTAASGAVGTNLTNFTALTGMSAKALQQWQYAARQAGVSGQEMESSLKGVQNSMTNMLLGKGMPEGLGLVAGKVRFDTSRARDTQYVLGQLQKFAQTVPPELANTVLKGFGLSEGVIAGMRRNAFRPDVFARAPTYSDKEIHNLDRANIAWANLGNKIEMAIGHLNAAHGGQLVRDLSKLTDQVLKFTESLIGLAERLKVFEGFGKIFEGWTLIFNSLNSITSGKADIKGGAEAIGNDIKSRIQELFTIQPLGNRYVPLQTAPQNIHINQNLNFQHEGKDAKKTGDSVHKAIKGAFRQIPAQGQGS